MELLDTKGYIPKFMIKKLIEVLFAVFLYIGLRALEAAGSIEKISDQQRAQDWADFKKLLSSLLRGERYLFTR